MYKPKVLGVGYGRHMFTASNAERERMVGVALETKVLHQIIFTHYSDGLTTQTTQSGLVLHPTNSRFKLLMVFDALLLGRKIIKSENGQLIITTQDPFAAGVVGWLLSVLYKLQLVVQEHGDVFGVSYWRQESVGNQLWYRVGRFILRRATVVRVVAKRVAQHVQSVGVSSRKITQLSVAIDLTQFAAVERVVKNQSTVTFITVARLVPQKNLTLLLHAFHAAWLQQPQLRLRIVGQGPEQKRLQDMLAQQYKNVEVAPVTIEPWSNNVPGLLAQADAYVLSSDYEGWGRVLIEAMVVGLPIVTTNVGCAGEVVKHEQHGLVVPTRDEKALEKALLRMATDRALQTVVDRTLAALDKSSIPGTDLDSYGKHWVESLTIR
jgi:glycosyltransferase involved in cell wall biosynthesis